MDRRAVTPLPEISVFPLAEQKTFDELRSIWREAERCGYVAVWHEDNLVPHNELVARTSSMMDCWIALATLAASTNTIRLGSMVTPAPRRHPALLARAAATLDQACGGRLTIGIGGGDPTTVDHYTQFGLAFPASGRERTALLREHLAVQQLLYTQDVANFDGEHFRLVDAVCSPKPVQQPHPPMWVGLSTRTTVMPAIAAELAQGVVIEWGDDEVAARVIPRLREACERHARDPATITKARHLALVVTAENMHPERAFGELARHVGQGDGSELRASWTEWMGGLVGTPERIAEELGERTVGLGFEHAMCTIVGLGFEPADGDPAGMAGLELAGLRALATRFAP
jgi:alkanesulfonate monooxygenase SsuD/methylene tetrahydromethanopterin reductase-like flavin-dependent oxidoreductase (luciferase family)